MLALAAGTLVGIALTLAAGSEPGFLLGSFIIVGGLVAALGVRPGAVHLFFPLPPFAFFVGAVITGKVHDSSISSTTTGLGVSLLQWIADIFFPMCLATAGVLLIGGVRWVLGRQVAGGQLIGGPQSADRRSDPRSPRPRTASGPRPGIDPWVDQNARDRRQAPDDPDDPRAARHRSGQRPDGAPWPRTDGGRPGRDPRDDRDQWGDPRAAADRRPNRSTPTRSAPPLPPQPAFRPHPVPPSDRASRPAAPPRSGAQRSGPQRSGPQRPARPPGDSWGQGY